jgi:hypothetical protein
MLKDSHANDSHAEPAQGLPKGARTRGKARAVIERPPAPQGWSTTDEDEIALRRWRGSTAITGVEALEPEHPVFGSFRVRSDAGSVYEAEIRSLHAHTNSCGCIDHRVNGLGTCKHIEGVLAALRRKGAVAAGVPGAAASDRVEVFIDRREPARPTAVWPSTDRKTAAVRKWLRPFLRADGTLNGTPDKIAKLLKAWAEAPRHVRRTLRVSRHVIPGSSASGASPRESRPAPASSPTWSAARRASTSSARLCCLISATA